MHSRFTRLIFISLVITITSVLVSNSQPVKRVLLEQHTGAWCGWCVDGSYVMDQLLEQYPNQIIGCKLHNGDAMVIPETDIIEGALSIASWPSGTIDRKIFGGVYKQNRGDWKTLCETSIAELPKVDIEMVYSINESTRELTATIRATMLETMSDELRFNVFVLEDSCSGTGTGWNQANYLSHLAGFENNPYYNLPNPIVGYQHMKVVRVMLGGAWGIKGEFATPALEGKTYTHNFTYTLDAGWKIKDIHAIGLIQVNATNNKEVLNAAKGTKDVTISIPSYELTSESPVYKKVVNQGTPFTKNYTLKNETDASVTYIVTASKSQRTPADWNVNLVPPTSFEGKVKSTAASIEITVEAQQTANFELQLTPGPTRGIGDATMNLEIKNEPASVKTLRCIKAASEELESFEVISPTEAQYSMNGILKTLGYNDFFEISPVEFEEFISGFPNKKIIVWNTGVFSSPSQSDISTMFEALNANIPMVLYGNQIVSGLGNDNSLGYFGVEYNGFSLQGYGKEPWRVWLSGVANDPISGDFGSSTEGNLIQYLITLMKITNWSTTHPVLHFSNTGKFVKWNGTKNDTLDIPGEEAIFGVRIVNNGNLVFLSSITPFVIKDANKRNKLVDNSIKWVLGMLDVDEEYKSENMEFSFDVSPNPVESSSMISYNLKGNRPEKLKFILYDNLGNELKVINNENVFPGEHIIPLGSEELSSGSYRLASYIGGKVFSIPVLITR
ncbi:MAG: Omp28-related outer membrane protein [Ignavibacteriae bacterium]|nr:Omp28-related outer membrane protein [Ignavibacteriota bacterium]